MAQRTRLAAVLNGLVRNVDLTADELVLDSVRLGGLAGTLLTKTILDSLIANSHAPMSDNQNVVAGDGLTGGGSGATVTLDVGAGSGISVSANAVAVDNTVVRTNGANAFSANQSMGGNKLTNLADPTVNSDAANKAYVDAVRVASRILGNIDVATTGNITLSGEQTIDGFLTSASRVLAWQQTDPKENGIYVSASGAWARSSDLDNSPIGEIYNGNLTAAVLNGTANVGKKFVITSVGTGTDELHQIGIDNIVWSEFSATAEVVEGNGIDVSGNTVSVEHDGQGLQFSGTALALELDGSTLSKSASGLKVADAGITGTQLAASVAGNGLAGGAGSALSVNVDGSTIEINSDSLRVKDAGITLAKLASNSVDENKLTTSVAGNGLSGGGGSALAVNVSASGAIIISSDALQINLEASNPSLQISSNELGIKFDPAGALSKAAAGTKVNVDNSSIEIATNALQIKDAGVTLAKLASNSVDENKLTTSVAGNGLAGGGGAALSVNVDGSTIEINSDSLRVKDAGITLAKLASNSVDENKLTTSVAGNGLTGGGGSALAVGAGTGIQVNANDVAVLYSPAVKIPAIAGEAFAANTTFAVRYALSGETAGRIYKADKDASVSDKFYVVGVIQPSSALSAGDPIDLIIQGEVSLLASDSAFAAGEIGQAVHLLATGAWDALSQITYAANEASTRFAMVKTTSSMLIQSMQFYGVN